MQKKTSEKGHLRRLFCPVLPAEPGLRPLRLKKFTYGKPKFVRPGIARDTAQRGGTLIVCHPDSSYEIVQVPLDSLG